MSVEMLIKYYSEISKDLRSTVKYFKKLHSIVVHSAPSNRSAFHPFSSGSTIYCREEIHSEKCCGVVGTRYFAKNVHHLNESRKFNSCLHGKISMDKTGQIKNCPSMAKAFGNIRTTKLQTVIENGNFRALWGITKDKIKICQNCEYRYICTDCRAYIEQPDDIYSKPLKCGYNPYTNVWEEWSTNPLKQATLKFYGMDRMS